MVEIPSFFFAGNVNKHNLYHMPLCFAPWTNIDISPTGNLLPCCKFQSRYHDESYNILDHDVADYVKSDFLKDIKTEMLANRWPRGCERCKIEEDNNIASKRQLDFARWQDHYEKVNINTTGFITASIAFGNTCNLKCITCCSEGSSFWRQEYIKIYGKDVRPVQFLKKHFVEDFANHAGEMIHFDIHGGEPFLSDTQEHLDLLQHYIKLGRSKSISLHYTTNGQFWPKAVFWDAWQCFDRVDIQLSIDGIADRYEYIRFPASWSLLQANCLRYLQKQQEMPNLQLSVSHTVSAYNIYYLDEFFSWCQNAGLPVPWCGRVHQPAHMRPTVWPKQALSYIADHLDTSTWTDLKPWSRLIRSHDDSELWPKFLQKMKQHDSYRNLDFAKTFPEMVQWLDLA